MFVETADAIYETAFHHAQIEITGCCNMHCAHCRASMEKPIFMPLEQIEKVLRFTERNMGEEFNLTLSGGEPLLHPELVEIVGMGVRYGCQEIVITTNGSLLTEELLQRLNEVSAGNVTIQVSLDSTDPQTHDGFRGFAGAYERAVRGLEAIRGYERLQSSIRMTIQKETYQQMEDMVRLAIGVGCVRIGVGNIIPAGLGAEEHFVLTPAEKKAFLTQLAALHRKYQGQIDITTEDPLKAIIEDSPWIDEDILENEEVDGLFGGCTAGIDCFNVDTEYNLTPCSVFRTPILNLREHEGPETMEQAYAASEVVQRMFSRTFSGKCNSCRHKRICGGCRATASFFGAGDHFCSDGTCWME